MKSDYEIITDKDGTERFWIKPRPSSIKRFKKFINILKKEDHWTKHGDVFVIRNPFQWGTKKSDLFLDTFGEEISINDLVKNESIYYGKDKVLTYIEIATVLAENGDLQVQGTIPGLPNGQYSIKIERGKLIGMITEDDSLWEKYGEIITYSQMDFDDKISNFTDQIYTENKNILGEIDTSAISLPLIDLFADKLSEEVIKSSFSKALKTFDKLDISEKQATQKALYG